MQHPAPQTEAATANKPARSVPDVLAHTLNDASRISGISRSTLYRHAEAGRLRLLKVGGRTLVDAVSLRALLGVSV
ncbi:helix-turn-helix domain-containing protein [Roseomonas xinghualingensis]|uniref:helix-turn-helix domain-containing protein n=1 Tax=Roseomonas xinghualingensis TaxID=2986475 RepID=UPI0021F184CE|nr:helix-turn-helix domain-containing protein [Roseomonas sp. SXEYE001]MCV4210419.1 helix-turn-helix domain-containing protein [Roseomonas sp. SXEYE001]